MSTRYAIFSRWNIAVRSLSDDKDIFAQKGFVRDVSFSQDGRTLAVAGAGPVSLVDMSDGTTRKKIDIPRARDDERIVSVCVSPGGERLGVVRFFKDTNRIRTTELTIWDVNTAKPVKTFSELAPSTTRVRFSPDGKLVATGSAGMGAENTHWPGEVRIWNLETGKRIQKLLTYNPAALPDDGYFLTDFVFSPEGAHVATASNGGRVTVWEVSSGKEIHTLEAQRGVRSIAFDGSGSRLVSGGDDRVVRVWDMATGAEINSMRGHARSINTVAFLDDQRIASAGRNIRIWDAASPQTARTYQGDHRGSIVFGIAFGPKSDLLGTGSMHVARIRDVKRGSLRGLGIRTGSNRPGPGVAFSSDGRLFGTTDRHGGKLWNVETGELVHELPDGVDNFFGTIFSIAFEPAGSLVATSGQDQLAIWNQKTGELVRKIKMDRAGSRCVVFSPDGKHVVTGHYGWQPAGQGAEVVPGEVNFWDVETGELKLTFTAGGTGSRQLSFDPDGRRIAVTTNNRVTLFDTGNGAKRLELRGHSATVNSVAFSPDGDRIASGSDDQTIRIWDANSGQELLSLHGHDWPVERVAFSPNGQHIASSSTGGVVKVWDATPPRELGLQGVDDDE